MSKEVALPWTETVGIAKLQFNKEPDSHLLVAAGWDKSLRLYHAESGEERTHFKLPKAQLACSFATSSRVACGGRDNILRLYDLEKGTIHKLGTHNRPISCLEYNPSTDQLATGGFDGAVKLWDCRGRYVRKGESHIETVELSEKVLILAIHEEVIIVGTRDRKIYVFDQRDLSEPLNVIDSPINGKLQAIAVEPSGRFFIVSSTDGRIAVEHLNAAEKGDNYVFKAHRETVGGQVMKHPVTALDFHPFERTFATGGADSNVCVWDPLSKQRLIQFHKYSDTIASLSFNFEGELLAIASSSTVSETEDCEQTADSNRNQIIVRRVGCHEIRPKNI